MREPPTPPWLRRLAAAALIFAFDGATGPAPAEEEVYTVENVAVDATEVDVREARRVALAAARREAWLWLIDRMATGDASLVPEPGAEALETFVQSLEFADEKIAAGRYRATVAVRFHADAVLDWLDDSGVPHALAPIPVMLVLPVLRTSDAGLLWEQNNPWLAAWRRPADGYAVEIVAPAGDLADLLAIGAEDALKGDWIGMRALADRYGTDGVLVAVADPAGGRIHQTLKWYDGPGGETVPLDIRSGTPPAAGAEAGRETGAIDDTPFPDTVGGALETGGAAPDDDDYRAAVDLARRSVSDIWAAAAFAPEGGEAVMVADIPIRGLADWVDVRNRLERPATLRRVLPLVVSVDRVRVELRYVGEIGDLRAGLRSVGLDLTAQGDDWIVAPP